MAALEKWSNDYELLMLFKRTQVQFLTLSKELTTSGNSSSGGSGTFL